MTEAFTDDPSMTLVPHEPTIGFRGMRAVGTAMMNGAQQPISPAEVYADVTTEQQSDATIIDIVPQLPKPQAQELTTSKRYGVDNYYHLKFTETGNPFYVDGQNTLKDLAWSVHAEGYRSMGFVQAAAVVGDSLSATIDKARGDNVDYYLALNPDDQGDNASIRKVNLEPSQDYTSLPGFQLCRANLSSEGLATLQGVAEQGLELKEISAMARTENASPEAVHELIRTLIQEGQGSNEAWFFSIVSTTYDSLAKYYGEDNFKVLGGDTPIHDDRVNDHIKLRPTIVDPNTFIDKVLDAYNAATKPTQRMRLRRSFMNLTEGLDDERMTPYVQAAREFILKEQE